MEPSTFEIGDLLVWATLGFAALSCVIVLWFLLRRPPLVLGTKLALLLGVFVFPILSAGSGNVAGFETTKKRSFCGGCHVMEPYTGDSVDPLSTTLASRHARNKMFGSKNCYGCHADYGMYGTVTTKMDGLVHALHYYTSYTNIPAEEAFGRIKLYRPFRNDACTKCHSTKTPGFESLGDHRGVMDEIRAGEASCASDGCHGPAHPFSKLKDLP